MPPRPCSASGLRGAASDRCRNNQGNLRRARTGVGIMGSMGIISRDQILTRSAHENGRTSLVIGIDAAFENAILHRASSLQIAS